MRHSSTNRLLDALFPRVRQRVLTMLLLHPERSWYRSDLAAELGVRPSSLQRELQRLTEAGVLRVRTEGNRSYFQANPESPVLPVLRGLLERTAGVPAVLGQVLAPFRKRIRAAFVFGSIARGAERPESDVDLIVVGSVTLKDLVPALGKAESRLGRPVNAHAYTAAEFAQKAPSNHFLKSVLDSEKVFVLGTEDDLGEVARRRPR